jgi:glycosyltransferase involved in cell wall biosynthesis
MIGIYCSNAYYESRAANYVQSLNTVLALGEHIDELEFIVRGKGIFSSSQMISSNVSLKQLYGVRGRFGGLTFLILTLMRLVRIKVVSKMHSKKSFMLARNIYAGFFAPFLFIDFRAIELHSLPSSFQLKLLKIYLCYGNSKIIVISHALKNDLAISLGMNLEWCCIVVADAHNASLVYSEEALSLREIASNREIKIAYFGSLNSYKGSELLFEVIRTTDYCIDIYTKDIDLVPHDVLKKCKCSYVVHSQIQNVMLSYDVTFIFLSQTGLEDDVSKYTSPLKLFECLAAGLIVVCTDCEVLKEVVDESCVIFVRNEVAHIINVLAALNADLVRRKALSKAAIAASLEHTYESRSSKIFNFIQS